MIDCLVFPAKLKKELQQVRISDGTGYERQFLELVIGKGCLEYQLEEFEKDVVDLATEGMSIHFGNIC